jgi:muconolactone delta-isomerase
MRMLVKFHIKDSVVGDLVPQARKRAEEVTQKMLGSGKAECSGLIAGERGGFVVMNVDSSEELLMMIGPMLDVADIKIKPLVPLESLPDILKMLTEMGY